jgi:hypothetical protein
MERERGAATQSRKGEWIEEREEHRTLTWGFTNPALISASTPLFRGDTSVSGTPAGSAMAAAGIRTSHAWLHEAFT